jgi:hypothetical protein
MPKGQISWKGRTPEGERREVYVHTTGAQWKFYVRGKRFDNWEPMPEPPLEDWLELLDAVQRRIQRKIMEPKDEKRVRQRIHERFPGALSVEPEP